MSLREFTIDFCLECLARQQGCLVSSLISDRFQHLLEFSKMPSKEIRKQRSCKLEAHKYGFCWTLQSVILAPQQGCKAQ